MKPINNDTCARLCKIYPCKREKCRREYDKPSDRILSEKEVDYWTAKIKYNIWRGNLTKAQSIGNTNFNITT